MADALILQVSIGVGSVAQAVTDKVEGQNADHDKDCRQQQPRRQRKNANRLRILEQYTPTDGGRLQAQANETERSLAQDHLWNRKGRAGDDAA